MGQAGINVADGYAPLCEFIGLPIPDAPFPRVNEQATIRRNIWLLRLAGPVFAVIGLAGLAGLASWLV